MPLIEDYYVVQTFPSNRTDQPLDECILPRTPGCGYDFFHS